ncbi:helix-turn-helix domain-containing protein [Nocardioides sp. DS6]|uniref:Helix-turn-helix domain-containing protein n=1 Tax=Nocardioides eburneus TaxID=3231482 RepID=A0ABV3SZT9_9ACTN
MPRLPPTLVERLHRASHQLPDRIAVRVRVGVLAFGGPRRGQLHRMVRDAASVAIDRFFRIGSGDHAAIAEIEEYFRGLGRAEALAGADPRRIEASIHIANTTVCEALQVLTAREDLRGQVVAELARGIAEYLVHLARFVDCGFHGARSAHDDRRRELLSALLKLAAPDDACRLAEGAGWSPPPRVVVLVAQAYGDVVRASGVLPAGVLDARIGDQLVVVSDERDVELVRRILLRTSPRVLVAESWPMPVAHTRDGYRWARAALALVARGRIRSAGRIVRCADHRVELWLEADASLTRSVSDEVLAPLAEEKASQQYVLAETLLGWLVVSQKAPALAAHLGVHPKTVRYRLKKLRRLFGEALDDPDQRLLLILCLKVTLPTWRVERGRR